MLMKHFEYAAQLQSEISLLKQKVSDLQEELNRYKTRNSRNSSTPPSQDFKKNAQNSTHLGGVVPGRLIKGSSLPMIRSITQLSLPAIDVRHVNCKRYVKSALSPPFNIVAFSTVNSTQATTIVSVTIVPAVENDFLPPCRITSAGLHLVQDYELRFVP